MTYEKQHWNTLHYLTFTMFSSGDVLLAEEACREIQGRGFIGNTELTNGIRFGND